jgi:uncharacterized protein (TIGR03382 family)
MYALLLFAIPSAHAWNHIGKMWDTDDIPLTWSMGAEEEESLAPGYSLEVIQKCWANWHVAECAAIGDNYDDAPIADLPTIGDGAITIHWNDPEQNTEVGVLGVTYPLAENVIVKETSTLVYKHMIDADIVFNDNVAFASVEDIEASCSEGTYSIEGVATHEIGHLWGMEHSCQDGDPCTDAEQRAATMYWSVDDCNVDQADINQDDIDGISALYGTFGTFYATTDRIGGTPLSVGFDVQSATPVVGVHWTFGDGGTSDELAPTHEYTTAGQFTVQAEIELEDATCGTTTYTDDQLGYVLACDAPAPEDGADGFFTLSHDDGLRWATVNHTDVSVYGCVDTISWEVYQGTGESDITPDNLVDLDGDGDGDTLGAWSPKITFPKAGNYVVVMNVGGPGGLDASFLPVVVEDVPGEGSGCDASGTLGAASIGGLLMAAAAGLRRRRRG